MGNKTLKMVVTKPEKIPIKVPAAVTITAAKTQAVSNLISAYTALHYTSLDNGYILKEKQNDTK
tara:strand:- start:5314 stop:5505 length:192 start_codon:yes stop_codon:yes gene_type:complete